MPPTGVSDAEWSEEEGCTPAKTKIKQHTHDEPTTNKRKVTFMHLPGEIRNMIYDYCIQDVDRFFYLDLTYQRQNETTAKLTADRWDDYPQRFMARLLLMSKAVHREVAPLLYSGRLQLANPDAAVKFMEMIGPVNVTYLHDIRLRRDFSIAGHSLEAAFKALVPAVNLKRLDIVCEKWTPTKDPTKDGEMLAKTTYGEARAWLAAIADARGCTDAGLFILQFDPYPCLWLTLWENDEEGFYHPPDRCEYRSDDMVLYNDDDLMGSYWDEFIGLMLDQFGNCDQSYLACVQRCAG